MSDDYTHSCISEHYHITLHDTTHLQKPDGPSSTTAAISRFSLGHKNILYKTQRKKMEGGREGTTSSHPPFSVEIPFSQPHLYRRTVGENCVSFHTCVTIKWLCIL